MKIYPSFAAWVKADVLLLGDKQERLDGWTNGKSNLNIVARFQYQNRAWEVHGDTRVAIVMRAYNAIPSVKDPFVVERTRNNMRDCLNLDKSLRRSRAKHFYVYETA